MKDRRLIVFLGLLIFVGSFLRLYLLNRFPPSLFADEADVGYQAYSILKTGKDYLGQPWPLSFHSISDWRTPLFLYATVPLVAIFGLNEWGVRLAPAIFGLLTIPGMYLLTKKLFKDKVIALVSTFLLVLSPWHIQYSRAAFEVSQMLFLFVWGLWLLLVSLDRPKWLWLSVVLLASTPYSYNTAKFFTPLLGVFLGVLFWRRLIRLPKKNLTIALIVAVICLAPMAYDIFRGNAADRFSILSIFSDPTTQGQIGFDRLADANYAVDELPVGTVPNLSARFFHNKLETWGFKLVDNYLEAFSSHFLFTFGDQNLRHSVQRGFGVMLPIDAIFLFVGLVYLFTRNHDRMKWFVLGWLFLSPIPSALTRDGANHATRLILMLPPLLIIVSLGMAHILKVLWRSSWGRYLTGLLFITYCLLFIFYLHIYYIHYPRDSEKWWHYGFKQVITYATSVENQYDKIVISDSGEPPLIHLLFWGQVDPQIAQNSKLILIPTEINSYLKANRLEGTKYYLGHPQAGMMEYNNIGSWLTPDLVYIVPWNEIKLDLRYDQLPENVKVLDQVYYPSGLPAYYILTGV